MAVYAITLKYPSAWVVRELEQAGALHGDGVELAPGVRLSQAPYVARPPSDRPQMTFDSATPLEVQLLLTVVNGGVTVAGTILAEKIKRIIWPKNADKFKSQTVTFERHTVTEGTFTETIEKLVITKGALEDDD